MRKRKTAKEMLAHIMRNSLDDCFKTVQSTMDSLSLDTAVGAELDDCAGLYVGLTRQNVYGTILETDTAFRKRIEDALDVDGDARFAAKLEPEVEKWDEEEREAKL